MSSELTCSGGKSSSTNGPRPQRSSCSGTHLLQRSATRTEPPESLELCSSPPPLDQSPRGLTLMAASRLSGFDILEKKKNPPQGAAELCQASQRFGRRAAVRFGSFEALHEAFTTPWKQRRRSDIKDQVCNSAGIPVNAPHTHRKNIYVKRNETDNTDPTWSSPLVGSARILLHPASPLMGLQS